MALTIFCDGSGNLPDPGFSTSLEKSLRDALSETPGSCVVFLQNQANV